MTAAALARFRLIPFEKITPDDGASYLVKGLLSSTGLAVVWGAPKCGKSFWTFDLLMHVALGWKYRGLRVTAGPIIYCALEGAQGFKKRIEAFRQAKLAEADSRSPPFYLMSTPLSLVADAAQLVSDIRAQLGDKHPVAVCIDTLNRSLAGSESSDGDMGAYIKAADAIRDAFGCLVVVVHHSPHDAQRPRGHSSLIGALDVQISVKRDGAGNIVAELELSKDGEAGIQFVSRLRVVEIGRDQDGDVITSCVVDPVTDAAATAAKPSKPAKARPFPKGAQTALRACGRQLKRLASRRLPQTRSRAPRASSPSRPGDGTPTCRAFRIAPNKTHDGRPFSGRTKPWSAAITSKPGATIVGSPSDYLVHHRPRAADPPWMKMADSLDPSAQANSIFSLAACRTRGP